MSEDNSTVAPPHPHNTLSDEGGSTAYWLASAWSLDDIGYEWDWLFGERPPVECLGQVWLRPRWTTKAELADEDVLYDLFAEELENFDTSVVYENATPESPGAYRYWTTEYAPEDAK